MRGGDLIGLDGNRQAGTNSADLDYELLQWSPELNMGWHHTAIGKVSRLNSDWTYIDSRAVSYTTL